MSESPPLRNFAPNELVFLVEHQNPAGVLGINEIHAFLQNALSDLVDNKNCPEAAPFRDFTVVEDYTNPYAEEERGDYFRPPTRAGDSYGPALYITQGRVPAQLADPELMQGIYAIYQSRGDARYLFEENALRLVSITPNWLTAGSPNEPPVPSDSGGGGGGPGGKPVEPDGAIPAFDNPWDVSAPWNFHLVPPQQPVTTQPQALSDQQLRDLAAALGLPITTPPPNPLSPTEIENISHVCYTTLNYLLETRMLTNQPTDPRTVKVVILDTAPPCEKPQHQLLDSPVIGLHEAYQQWSADNALLRSLLKNYVILGPAGGRWLESDVFKITYYKPFDHDPGEAPYDPCEWSLKRICQRGNKLFDWIMDHGSFIAGIVHTLAPQVKIHLIEVLNAYGCGTLATYTHGLALALSQFDPATERLVVNMSLTFPIALDSNHPPLWLKDFDEELKERSQSEGGWDDVMQKFLIYLTMPIQYLNDHITLANGVSDGPLSDVFNLFAGAGEIEQQGGIVVAAAGNNGTGTYPPPAACAPAAFSTVLGVAALKSNHQNLTDYSNNADIPAHHGVAVFGGDKQTGNNSALTDPRKGILGLYIGLYPNPNPAPDEDCDNLSNVSLMPSTTSWARWAGTSFAAPVVSGILAEMLRRGWEVKTALNMVRLAFSETNGRPDWLRIRQGDSDAP